MRYIIDGYNLMFRILRAGDDIQKQRSTIIHDLNAKANLLNLDITLVFDGQYKYGEEQRTHFDKLEILFTAEGETADEYIVGRVKHAEKPQDITVVTSDKKLSWLVRRRSGRTEEVDGFLNLLNRRYRNKLRRDSEHMQPHEEAPAAPQPPKPKKPAVNAAAEECFDYYLNKFEEELGSSVSKPVKPGKPAKKQKLIKREEPVSDDERWLRAFTQNPQDDPV